MSIAVADPQLPQNPAPPGTLTDAVPTPAVDSPALFSKPTAAQRSRWQSGGKLPALVEPESALRTWLGGVCAVLIAVGWFIVFHVYWGPAHLGVDQNGYLVGGRMFADHLSTGMMPPDYFGFVGRMWIGTSWETYYPKYPIGLPVLFAGLLKLGATRWGRAIAYLFASWQWGVTPIAIFLPLRSIFQWISARSKSRRIARFRWMLTPLCLLITAVATLIALRIKAGPLNRLPTPGPSVGVYLCYLLSPLAMASALVATYQLVRLMAGTLGGILAMLIVACSPVTLELTNNPNSHATTLFCVAWGMFLLIRWWQVGGAMRASLAGFLLGYAVTIRYTEGMLLLPIVVVALMNVRWRSKRSLIETALLLAWWALPVMVLVCFNLGAFGAVTGYDSTNESTGFTWEYFQNNWETTVRQLYNTGLFFLLPVSIAGIVVIFIRSWRMAVLLCAWIVPSVILYTAYYWAPDGQTTGYLRFYLTIFPALAMPAMWLLLNVIPAGLSTRFTFPLPEQAPSPSPGTPGEGRGEGDFELLKSPEIQGHPQPNLLPVYRERRQTGLISRPGAIAFTGVSGAFAIISIGILLMTIGDQRYNRANPLLADLTGASLPAKQLRRVALLPGAMAAANKAAAAELRATENADDRARLIHSVAYAAPRLPVYSGAAAIILALLYWIAYRWSSGSADVFGGGPIAVGAVLAGLITLASTAMSLYTAEPDMESNARSILQASDSAQMLVDKAGAPDGSIIFGEEPMLNHLQFVGNYQVYDLRQFTLAYIQALSPDRFDPTLPNPLQAERATQLFHLVGKYRLQQLLDEEHRIANLALANGRHVYVVIPMKQLPSVTSGHFPAKQYKVTRKIVWQEPPIVDARVPRKIHWQGFTPAINKPAPKAADLVQWVILEVEPLPARK